jgi:predicted metalloprotease
LNATSAIGDDRLRRHSQDYVAPDFVHETSEQRVRWFKRGYTSGVIDRCDTFVGY